MSYESRLFKAFRKAPVLPLDAYTRYCLFSDCHRGDGSTNDNFLKNYNLYFSALKYYYNAGYTYVEVGDGDELWENRNIRQIIEIHNNVFRLLSRFYCRNRLFLLYGNHDMEKKTPGYANHFCAKCHCDLQKEWPLFPELPWSISVSLTHQCRQKLSSQGFHRTPPVLLRQTAWFPLNHRAYPPAPTQFF